MFNLFRILCFWAALTTPALAESFRWIGPDGKAVAFADEEDLLEFLRTARVVSLSDIPVGITKPKKVLLEKDGIRLHAVFRYVDIYKKFFRDGNIFRTHYRDSAFLEVAAYRLSRLLGMNSIPPTVKREIEGTAGSLQVWVEDALSEGERKTTELKPPSALLWVRQYQEMWLFDNLIFNEDRNQGNLLVDEHWKLWLIDATRAFRPNEELLNPTLIRTCNRETWERLRGLDPEVIRDAIGEVLTGFEMDALLKRRLKLLDYIEELIETRGVESVLFSNAGDKNSRDRVGVREGAGTYLNPYHGRSMDSNPAGIPVGWPGAPMLPRRLAREPAPPPVARMQRVS